MPGFRVLGVEESAAEVVILIEMMDEVVGRPGCGVIARAHGRVAVDYRDLAALRTPGTASLVEAVPALRGASVLDPDLDRVLAPVLLALPSHQPRRCRVLPPARPQRPPGDADGPRGRVCWDTVMDAVREHGEALINDPKRVGEVTALGVDETS